MILIVETVLDIKCPMCSHGPLRYITTLLDLPYFEEVVNTTITCDKCNYKYSDILITHQNKPMEHKFKASRPGDLNVRVIRSTSATIELPELGITIEPATASEAFVSNIEGVLARAQSAVELAGKFAEDDSKKAKADELLSRIESIRNGTGEVTVIIKDPMGNSGIVSEQTEKRELTKDELARLETGITIIDIDSKKEIIP